MNLSLQVRRGLQDYMPSLSISFPSGRIVMPNVNLDAVFVRNAVCPEGKSKINFFDNAITGFILEVRSTGGKTYALRHRDAHGRQRQIKIGDTKSVTFDRARSAAEKLRSRVVLGESPAEEKMAKRAIPTIAE